MRPPEVLDHDLVYPSRPWAWVRYVLVAALALGWVGGCATMAKLGVVDSTEDRYTYWTRYYETRMALTPARIVFEDIDGLCAFVDADLEIGKEGPVVVREVVHYDPKQRGCREPWQIAKHEQCHRRMQHIYYRNSPDREVDAALKEEEADHCEWHWYK